MAWSSRFLGFVPAPGLPVARISIAEFAKLCEGEWTEADVLDDSQHLDTRLVDQLVTVLRGSTAEDSISTTMATKTG